MDVLGDGPNRKAESISLNHLTQAIRRQPFRPFQLVLVDGRAFLVDHPEFVAIDRHGREATFYAGDNTQHFVDSGLIAEIVLTSVEESAGAQSPAIGD